MFIEDSIKENNSLIIYTDGACSGNPGPGAFAILVIENDRVIGNYAVFEANTTSNRMELSALLWVFDNLSAPHMHIYSDSNYVVQGINDWLESWKRKNWRTTTGPVKNLDLWQQVDALLIKKRKNRETFQLHWVKGHSNNPYNNQVDRLARQKILSKGK